MTAANPCFRDRWLGRLPGLDLFYGITSRFYLEKMMRHRSLLRRSQRARFIAIGFPRRVLPAQRPVACAPRTWGQFPLSTRLGVRAPRRIEPVGHHVGYSARYPPQRVRCFSRDSLGSPAL
jgi:hypothetical protein